MLNKILKFKKVTALSVATTMLLNLIGMATPNNIFITDVYGATTYGLTATFDSSLTYDVSSPYPIESSILNPNNTDALVSWDYEFGMATQNVTIPIDDNKMFQVNVSNIESDNFTEFEISFVDSTGDYIPVPTPSYSIYSSFDDTFAPYDVYYTDYNSSERSIVLESDSSLTGHIDNAKFSMEDGTGYSIIYGGKNYRIIWKNGEVQIYLENDIKEGYIYSLSMNGEEVTHLSKGLNLNSFNTEPFANMDKGLYDKVMHIDESDPWPAYDLEDRGMYIDFELPKWYDTATNTFTSASETKFPNTTLQLNIGTVGEKAFQVRLNDVLNYSGGTYGVSVDLNSTSNNGVEVVSATDGIVKLKVPELEAGVIYTNNRLELAFSSSINVIEKPQTISTANKIYTFPFYDIIQVAGELYMEVQPFVNEHNQQLTGVYILNNKITANKNDPQISVNRNGFKPLIRLNHVGGDPEEKVIFPLDIKTITDINEAVINAREYFISFDLNATAESEESEGNIYYSQPLYYEPEIDKSVLGAPSKFVIEHYNLSALFDENGVKVDNRSNLELGISWILGPTDKIDPLVADGKTLDIDYNLRKSLTQNLDDEWDDTAGFTISLTEDAANSSIFATAINNLNNDKYEILDKDNVLIVKEKYGDTLYYKAYLDFVYDAGNVHAHDDEIEFQYPNIYFLTLNYLQTLDNGEVVEHISSLEDLTLNDESFLEVPTASNLETKNVTTLLVSNEDARDQVSFDVDWYTLGSDIYNYLKSLYTEDMLQDPNVGINMHYNLYISQKESHFTEEFYEMDYEQRVRNATNTDGMAIPFDYNALNKPTEDLDNRIILNNINGDTINLATLPIEYLRNTSSETPYVVVENVPISPEDIENFRYPTAKNINQILRIDGLDINTKYFGFLELVIEHDNLKLNDGSGDNIIEYSKPSVIFAETTKDVLDVPDPSDTDPSVPEVIVDTVNIKDASFIIKPNLVSEVDGYTQKLDYEVLRLKTKKLDDMYMQNKSSISVFLDDYTKDYANKQAYLLEDGLVKEYDESVGMYVDTIEAESIVDDEGIHLKDVSLDSNKIYYYYFRTVKTVTEIGDPNEIGVVTYSNWLPINITTSTIQPPKDLLIKQDENFDRETQVALQFSAMISNIFDIGVKDFLELSIRKEGEEWSNPTVMDYKELQDNSGLLKEDGYRDFVYLIDNLEPGKTYYFKVRHRLADGTQSLYSEAVRWKTDLGDDYDKETDIKEWDDFVKDIVEDLLNTDEWVLTDNVYKHELLYLANKWENQIDRLVGKTFTLKDFKSDKINTVYIPSYIYEQVMNNNLNVDINYENVNITLNSGFINNYTTALNEMKKNINSKATDDYYLKVDLYPENMNRQVNNSNPISDKVSLNLSLVAFDRNIKAWENEVTYEVTQKLVESFLKDKIRDDIEDAVLDDEEAKEILKLIEEYKEEILEEAEDLISEDFKDMLNRKLDKDISKYAKNITYSVINDNDEAGFNVTGHKMLGTNFYVPQKTTTLNNESFMMADTDGSFVFTEKQFAFENGNNDLNNTNEAFDIISKYDLYDTLAVQGSINTNGTLTNEILAESYSKITNTSYNDSVNSLVNLGVNINDRTKNRAVTKAQLTNVVMSIYENKTNTLINSYKITDYVKYNEIFESVNNSKMAKALYVANELGIYTNTDYNDFATIGMFVDELTTLQEIIEY